MSDINSYANDLLIEFLDATHERLAESLRRAFGDAWLSEGVERHVRSAGLERTRQMLHSPMAVVDMGKTDEELYGVEHLSSIVLGNWSLFGDAFGHRTRTEVYFGEVSELRHNISHRRQHHLLRRSELLRFVHNGQLLLRALGSPTAAKFKSVATSLEEGGSPWGSELGGALPLGAEIVSEFVGREAQMRSLSAWLAAEETRQLVIWGYGGSGKSALAYQFARAVRDGAPASLEAVLWLSAKTREFIEGETRDRLADFHSIASFGQALWAALYDATPSQEQMTSDGIVKELTDTPMLLIVDDLDSVLDDDDLAHFLLYEAPRSKSRILYTSRQRVHGLQKIDVAGFTDGELDSFIRSRAHGYELDAEECLAVISAIQSVTGGIPLFVDDLMRHAMLGGLKSAINDWSQRKGDAAREYALRRQLASLGEAARRALIGVSVASRPVSSLELSTISGFTDDDVQHAIQDLLNWRLLNRLGLDVNGRQTFSCNRNTRRLVQKTYGTDPVYKSYQASFKNLTGASPSPAFRKAVGSAISNARALVLRNDLEGAQESLRSTMTGELDTSSDLWGALGWVYSREKDGESATNARTAFRRSHDLGSRKEDTYFHWAEFEREIAESLVNRSSAQDLLKQWRAAAHVAELGIARCGETPALCQFVAYLRTREAKTLESLNQFTSAETCFRQGEEWARRALSNRNPQSREVSRTRIYRSLVVALEGSGETELMAAALREWKSAVGKDDPECRREHERLVSLPEVRKYLE